MKIEAKLMLMFLKFFKDEVKILNNELTKEEEDLMM